MNIAFYIPVLNVGGAEKVVINLLNSISLRQLDKLSLITDKDNSSWLKELSPDIDIVHLSANKNSLQRLNSLRRIVKENKFDIVVSHLTHSNIHCLLLRLVLNFRLLIVEHSITSEYLRSLGAITNMIKSTLVKSLFGLADKIVCVSQSTQIDLIKNFNINASKCEIIFNPMNFDEISALSKIPIPQDVKEFIGARDILVSVGRVEKVKNHASLVYNLKNLLSDRNYVLLIVGDGTERVSVQKVINELNLTNNVLMIGFDSNPYRYIASSKCLLHASSFEGFGLVLLEAIYLQTAVVTKNFTAAFEVLDNGRLGVIIDDLTGFDKAVTTIFENFSAVDQVNNSKVVQNHYNAQIIADQYLNLCYDVSNNRQQ